LALIASVANLATLRSTIHPSLLVNATFTYPPFPAVPPNTPYLSDTPKITGNCSQGHLFEYNISTVADLTVTAELTLPQVISKTWKLVPWSFPEKMLASGCHIAGTVASDFYKVGNSIVKDTQSVIGAINRKLGNGTLVLSVDIMTTNNESDYMVLSIIFGAPQKRQTPAGTSDNVSTSDLQNALGDFLSVDPKKITVTLDPTKPGVAAAKIETGTPVFDSNSQPPQGEVVSAQESVVDKIASLQWYYVLAIGAALMAFVCIVIFVIVIVVKKATHKEERV